MIRAAGKGHAVWHSEQWELMGNVTELVFSMFLTGADESVRCTASEDSLGSSANFCVLVSLCWSELQKRDAQSGRVYSRNCWETFGSRSSQEYGLGYK